MVARIPLPKDEDLNPESREILSLLPPLNLFRMLGNAPASIKEFLDMGASILMRSEFDARKREIAILRVAHVTKAPYVWHHHVKIGKTAGITDEEIEKIACDGPVTSLDDEGNLLCRAAAEISRREVDDPEKLLHIRGLMAARLGQSRRIGRLP